MKGSKRATNSLNGNKMEELTSWNSYFFAGKAYLKLNSLVKMPLHEFIAVERSGLWAPALIQFNRISHVHCYLRRSVIPKVSSWKRNEILPSLRSKRFCAV